jgi:hypothetical protein
MKFLWFGKKKAAPATAPESVEALEPQEVFSVNGFAIESNPESGNKKTELSHQTINSMALSVLAQASGASDLAAQEFFQERGANVLPIASYTFSAERGFSARVQDGNTSHTVLIGPVGVISKATTPFCASIAAATAQNPDSFVVAIDGIAYAVFSISRELI